MWIFFFADVWKQILFNKTNLLELIKEKASVPIKNSNYKGENYSAKNGGVEITPPLFSFHLSHGNLFSSHERVTTRL